MIIEVCAGFVVAPFLVHRLGLNGYGLWIIIGSLSGYFSLVDLGLRGSVGRQLALDRAEGDWARVNRTLSSALAIFCGLALITLIATGVVASVMDRMFDIPADQLRDARVALLLVGLNLSVSFPLQAFDGYLWAAQRFDLLNYVDIPVNVARVALTMAFIRTPEHIVTLAAITVATGAGSGLIKAILSFRLDRSLHVHPMHFSDQSGKSLFSYGWWTFVITVASLTKTQLSPVLIGSLLGVAQVTPFSIARRLQDYSQKVIWTATGVLVPVATGFHALSAASQQQRLFVEGGKYSASAALFFTVYLVSFGRDVISVWMGPQFGYTAVLLSILAIGAFLPMTQAVTGSIILATARHKTLAWISIIEMLVTIVLISLLARPYGLIGICIAFAIPQIVLSGSGTLIYGCRVTGVPVRRYLVEAILPAVTAGALPVLLLVGVLSLYRPAGWPSLLLYSGIFTATYAASCLIVLKPASGQTLTDVTAAFLRR